MPITLTITDAGNGTGGTATIAGSTGANSLYRATWTGIMGVQLAWTLVGTRSGDGTIALTGTGFYQWRLDNAGVFSALVYQNLTDATIDGPLKQIMDNVARVLVSLNLSGINSIQVLERWHPRVITQVDSATLPKAFVCPWDRLNFPGLLTGKDDIGIPVIVCFAAAQNQDNEANINRNSLWSWRTLSAFRFQQLQGVSASYGLYTCEPEASEQVNQDWFARGIWFSAMSLRFITRTPRGLI